MSFTYNRLNKDDVTLLMVDHQAGLRLFRHSSAFRNTNRRECRSSNTPVKQILSQIRAAIRGLYTQYRSVDVTARLATYPEVSNGQHAWRLCCVRIARGRLVAPTVDAEALGFQGIQQVLG